MTEPYINKHILAAKDTQIAQYTIALKVANEEAEDLRKVIDNLKAIVVQEYKENKKLRGQIMKLERTVKAYKKEGGM